MNFDINHFKHLIDGGTDDPQVLKDVILALLNERTMISDIIGVPHNCHTSFLLGVLEGDIIN